MSWNLWQQELAMCGGNWWSRPQLCNGPTGTSVGWWVSPSCVFSGSFLSLPLATIMSACHRLIYLQKTGKIEKMTCPKILQALLIEECYRLGEVIDLLHTLPQFMSTLRIVFALWRAVSLALFQQKKRKKESICYMKQQQGIVLLSGKTLQELGWLLVWSLLLLDTAYRWPKLCAAGLKQLLYSKLLSL